jgi:hypothetical protein
MAHAGSKCAVPLYTPLIFVNSAPHSASPVKAQYANTADRGRPIGSRRLPQAEVRTGSQVVCPDRYLFASHRKPGRVLVRLSPAARSIIKRWQPCFAAGLAYPHKTGILTRSSASKPGRYSGFPDPHISNLLLEAFALKCECSLNVQKRLLDESLVIPGSFFCYPKTVFSKDIL